MYSGLNIEHADDRMSGHVTCQPNWSWYAIHYTSKVGISHESMRRHVQKCFLWRSIWAWVPRYESKNLWVLYIKWDLFVEIPRNDPSSRNKQHISVQYDQQLNMEQTYGIRIPTRINTLWRKSRTMPSGGCVALVWDSKSANESCGKSWSGPY